MDGRRDRPCGRVSAADREKIRERRVTELDDPAAGGRGVRRRQGRGAGHLRNPLDSQRPVICRDEQPVQLLKDTRTPIAGTKTHPQRVDSEYERAATAGVLLFGEPLGDVRFVPLRHD